MILSRRSVPSTLNAFLVQLGLGVQLGLAVELPALGEGLGGVSLPLVVLLLGVPVGEAVAD
jgi:hypothetical protein